MKFFITFLFLTSTLLSGKEANLKFLGKELKRDLNILFISQEPGYEDISLISYFKFELGAKITSAYITNGEGNYNEKEDLLPADNAPKKREEAASVIKMIGGDYYFLNLPYTVSSSLEEINKEWNKEIIKQNISDLINATRTNVIILMDEKNYLQQSHRYNYFKSELKNYISNKKNINDFGKIVLFEESSNGIEINTNIYSEELHENYNSYGKYSKMLYRSIPQKYLLRDTTSKKYLNGSIKKYNWQKIVPQNLKEIKNQITTIGKKLEKGIDNKSFLLKEVAIIISEIDLKMRDKNIIKSKLNVNILFEWKKKLENIRVKLLEIKLFTRLSENVLASAQITYLDIDSVSFPIELKGKTEIYFPMYAKGWIINESLESRLTFEYPTRYRILSPRDLQSYIPEHIYYPYRRTLNYPYKYILIHYDENPIYNFMVENTLEITPADRFIAEPKWPVVRLQKNEIIPMYFQNNSRDPVYDIINVNDTLAVGPPINFRLMNKGNSQLDTLTIEEVKNAPTGDYLLNITIKGDVVGKFAARKFDVEVDTPKSVFVRSQLKTKSILYHSLNRIGVKSICDEVISDLQNIDIVIIDRNEFLKSQLKQNEVETLNGFINSGGKIIILSQEAESMNSNYFANEINLKTDSDDLNQKISLKGDLLLTPNKIENLFDNWLYQKINNSLIVKNNGEILIGDELNPVISSKKIGKGLLVYVNLNLHHQLMNIHPPTYKLLGNLISLKNK